MPDMTEEQIRAAILKTIKKEGGYVNDPHDSGGETKYGISKRSWPQVDIAKLTVWDAFKIYKQWYADPLRIKEIDNPRIGWKIFDVGVNAGLVRAVKLAQEVTGAEVDGIMGPQTIHAINETDEATFFMHFIPALEAFYADIVERNPTQQKFMRQWLVRASDTGAGIA
jgi:lysozyme family protein